MELIAKSGYIRHDIRRASEASRGGKMWVTLISIHDYSMKAGAWHDLL